MPRGDDTIEIMTPVSGARFDLPPHKLQPDMLAAGSVNVHCDRTDILTCRPGFTQIARGGPQLPVTGGISWLGAGDALRVVIADTQGWWTYAGDLNGQFMALQGTVAGLPTRSTQFAVFWVGGIDNLFGVNNVSGLTQWIPTAASISQVSGLPFTSARDMFVLANRLVVLGTTEGGLSFPYRVRWSEINNPTSFLPASFNDILDPGGSIRAGQPLGALQAFIYMDGEPNSLQTMIAQAGTDANAFAFQQFALGQGVVPPASPACLISVDGFQYYLGSDGRIWQFNGIAPTNFGIPIQSFILSNINRPYISNSFAVYHPAFRLLKFYFPIGSSQFPNASVVYSLDFQRWEAPWTYGVAFQSGFSGPWGPPAAGQISAARETAILGGASGGVFEADAGLTDNGVPIPIAAFWGPRNLNPLEKMQVHFVEGFIAQAVAADTVDLIITGMREPLGVDDGGTAFLFDLTQESQFQMLTAPGVRSPGRQFYNWLRVGLTGVLSGNLMFIGAYIQVNVLKKGVYNRTGTLGPE